VLVLEGLLRGRGRGRGPGAGGAAEGAWCWCWRGSCLSMTTRLHIMKTQHEEEE